MAMRAALVLLTLLHSSDLHPVGRPTNGLSQCQASLSITALEALPGGGWDNLRNMDMGRVRNLVYTAKAYPDFAVDSSFAQQAEQIADAIENNQTKHAAYLSEKMVLDYGTHVIMGVDAGATLVQEDYLRSSYVANSQSQTTSVSVLAGLNFYDKLKFDISSKDSTLKSALQAYQSNITYSLTQSHRGIPFYPGMTLQKWQESTRNNLVAIDRTGLPLHYFINTETFPDMPEPMVGRVALLVGHAIKRYYAVNTRCVDVDSKNFNFQANVDDKSCQGPATSLSFGGVYQQCSPLTADADPICQALAQKNIDTGNFTCRSPYIPTLLRSEVRQEGYDQYEKLTEAYTCFIFFTCYREVWGNVFYVRKAKIDTYWCSVNGKSPEDSGYLFGGIYSPSLLNPITKTKSCPLYFIPQKFLSDGLTICVSNDYEMATTYSVPFGGLISCESANPLAGNQRHCPAEFSQHLATVSDGCEVLYCVQSGLFTGGQLQPIHLPPFTLPPLIGTMGMGMNKAVEVMSEGGQSWSENLMEVIRKLQLDSGEMTAGSKAGLAFGIIGLLGILAVGGMFLVRKRASIKRNSYEQIDEQPQMSETAVLLPEEEVHK